MLRLLFAIGTAWCFAIPFVDKACASTNVVSQTGRTTIKEPTYQSAPKYSLLTLGSSGEVKVWMVEDGKRLFVDKNANGDLTDDGPPIEPGKFRDMGSNGWGFEYLLAAITPTNGSRHTGFVLRRWNFGTKEDSYGLSLSVDSQMPMYAGWFGTFWSTNREQAPVMHFGGPFTPKLLRRKEFIIGETQQRLSLCFVNPGSGPGAQSRLSIDALPRFVVPVLNIEWPNAGGTAPQRTSHPLIKRCCDWEFYTPEFDVPKGVVAGTAKISVHLPSFTQPIELTTTEMLVPVEQPVESGERGPAREAGEQGTKTTSGLILFGVLEMIGLVVIIGMWMKRWHRRWAVRVIWSAVLLVPAIGLLAYFFLRESPGQHPYDTDTMRSAAESIDNGSGGHHQS